MSSTVCKSFLSVVTRFSGYAIAVVLPKDGGYIVLGNKVRKGVYTPKSLYESAIDLWEYCVNQPRQTSKQTKINPYYLLTTHIEDHEAVDTLLKDSSLQAEYNITFEVPPEKAEDALMSLQRLFNGGEIKTTPETSKAIEKALSVGDTLDFEKGFKAIPLSVAAIAQAIAEHQYGKLGAALAYIDTF